MGFTKLDSGIVDSSIWDEPSDVLKVFQTFWTKSNSKGSVRATHESLFRTANLRDMSGNPLSLEWFDECLKRLMSADSRSRSKDSDGRRIIRVSESEWQIVTYQQNREKVYSSNPESVRKRQQRLGHSGTCPKDEKSVLGHSASASVSASDFVPTKEMAEKWLSDWQKSGADYTKSETESAFLALSANGWMWGKNPVVDFRAALERQIQTDRQRTDKSKPSNGGVVLSPNIFTMQNQTALTRVEDRLKYLRGQMPLTDEKLKSEFATLKIERVRLMEILGFKA